MTHSITYFNRVDVKREDGLKDIENALVKSFYKAIEFNDDYFNEINDETIKTILKEELEKEVKERKERGSKRLRKLKLIPCLPEDATHINVAYRISNSIVSIETVTDVRIDPDFSNEKSIEKYNKEKNDLKNDPDGLHIFASKIWSI